ncbi:o-succinylbenzoate synthase [Mariniblastus sp.]|nr:o-succinylbenzoate synthase [Mariniblastus sp.]
MNAYRFSIPLTRPLTLKGETYTTREGVLIERDGKWAEASPLLGFSLDSIDDVIAGLRGEQGRSKSFEFALSALEEPAVERIAVPWNFLLVGDRDRVMAGVDRCVESCCKAAKLKVGRGDLRAEIELVWAVRERLPSEVQLRLDANQAWTLDEAALFIESLQGIDLEYIEEPLQDPQQLEELFSRTGVRYALDETLTHHELIDAWPNAAALICKPTILGGRVAVERLAAAGKPITFTAAFESGVGIARIVQLAAEFSPDRAAGIDTIEWLEDDLLMHSPSKQDGIFSVVGEPVAERSKLEPIEL